MITVIIPTMWKGREIVNMLPVVNDHPLIGEIILIDNAPEDKNEAVCSLSKVKYVTFGHNIFPIPSWNYGAANAQYDKLLIINDDVLFDPALIDAMDDAITEDVGTITMEPHIVFSSAHDQSVPNFAKKEDIKFMDTTALQHGSAIVLGIHKNNYIKIPEELLIYFNDEFLFRISIVRGKVNKFVHTGCICKTVMSSTVRLFPEITNREWGIFQEIFAQYGIYYGQDQI